MDLSTSYLGLKLRSPFIVGASPFCDDTFIARRLQDSGAGAVVMRSLFEEQLERPTRKRAPPREDADDDEAIPNYPEVADYQLSTDEYLLQLAHLKANLTIPVVASIGGISPGPWTSIAIAMADAGADAIELNLYHVATDPKVSGAEIEQSMLETVRDVSKAVRIPVAVKLTPFHSSLPQFAAELVQAGASGLVLFNRFYQPDINPAEMQVLSTLHLSDSHELLPRLRWLAVLSPQIRCSLAGTGGVHTANDALKAILAGATVVQVVSVLLKHGPRFLSTLVTGVGDWMRDRGFSSIEEFRGQLNLRRFPDPALFERANYIRILQRWKV